MRQVPEAKESVAKRWWRYRAVHRLFGLKFWSFVVGAAPLESSLESFWGRLGFVVVQGYGLTETAPIVTLNHPFSTSKGSVGKPIAGVDVKIAPDGEILVRGDNVTTGYYGAPEATGAAFEDGWFHTGDIGELDEAGRLFIRGRKKEMIVTPEGLNVFPEDVERVVNAVAGVRDSAAVGVTQNGEERVQVALVVEPGTSPADVVKAANAQLERSSAHSRRARLARRRAAAHRRHEETEASRDPRVAPDGRAAGGFRVARTRASTRSLHVTQAAASTCPARRSKSSDSARSSASR